MRLLVVDDEHDIPRVLKAGLEAENFVVDTAYDGEQGSLLARTNNYDAIILDDMLPHKSGRQVCREIRASENSSPILMLTVQSDLECKVEAFESGADDYLTKPFSFKELPTRIRALLRRPQILKMQSGFYHTALARPTLNSSKTEMPYITMATRSCFIRLL